MGISKTQSNENNLVKIKKDALGLNTPSKDTIISQWHKVRYYDKMIPAMFLVKVVNSVESVKYEDDILYNVLMDEYSEMRVNNMVCETLHPDNEVAKKIMNSVN